MKLRSLLILAALFIPAILSASDNEFTADRPGVSTGPNVVAKNVIQLEEGIQFDRDQNSSMFTFSNTLIRYGLFDNVELRLSGDAFLFSDYEEKYTDLAFSGISVGTKIKCFEGDGAIPAISFLANVAIPYSGSCNYSPKHFTPSMYALFENQLTDQFNLGYNVGFEWDGSSPATTTFLAVCLGYNINDRFGAFVENYNYISSDLYTLGFDLGVNYMLTDRLQLDLATNLNIFDYSCAWAISFGIAWQINN